MSGIVRLASLILILVFFGGESSGHALRLSNSEDGKKGPILELHVKVGSDGGSWNIGVDEVIMILFRIRARGVIWGEGVGGGREGGWNDAPVRGKLELSKMK